MDFRRGQTHRFHLQGVVGNSAARFGIPAEQRAVQNRSFFFFGQDHRIVCSITAKGPPAEHSVIHRTAADGYRIVCSITAKGPPGIHSVIHRTAADGYHIVCGGAAVFGKPAVHRHSYRAAADGYRIVCSITAIGPPAGHSPRAVVSYRTAADGYRIVCGITVPGISAVHIRRRVLMPYRAAFYRNRCPCCRCIIIFTTSINVPVYIRINNNRIVRRIANIVTAFQVSPAVGQHTRRRNADRHRRQGRGNMTAVQGRTLAAAFYKFGYRHVTVSSFAPDHFVNLVHRRSSIVFFSVILPAMSLWFVAFYH